MKEYEIRINEITITVSEAKQFYSALTLDSPVNGKVSIEGEKK